MTIPASLLNAIDTYGMGSDDEDVHIARRKVVIEELRKWNTAEVERLEQGTINLTVQLNEARKEIERLNAELAAAKEWKDRVIDALVVSWAYKKEHETNPQLAIADLVMSEIQMALDPQISSGAQKLIDDAKEKHYEECAEIAGKSKSGWGAAATIRAALSEPHSPELRQESIYPDTSPKV
jgi:hypothetical protein